MKRGRLVLGGLETAVLGVLWERGESTVAEVVSGMPAAGARHPNTVATVLNRMAARGVVARRDAGRAATYRARVTREEMGRRCLEMLREEILGGSLPHFVAALVRPSAKKGRHSAKLHKLLQEIESEEKRGR